MKIRSLLVATAAGMLTLTVATPALAADTTFTFTVEAGSFGISVPATTVSLGNRVNTVGAGTLAGPLGQVQVNDARHGTTGWVTSVISTAFAGPVVIPASAISYAAGSITTVGPATHTASPAPSLLGASIAVTASAVTSDNSATWNPTMTIAVPGSLAAGVYTATITHSLA